MQLETCIIINEMVLELVIFRMQDCQSGLEGCRQRKFSWSVL